MPNTYEWKIIGVESDAEGNVLQVRWQCSSSDGEMSYVAKGHKEYAPDPASPTYTPFDQLTEEQVLDWVWKFFSKTGIEEHCASQLRYRQSMKRNTQMPWQINSETV